MHEVNTVLELRVLINAGILIRTCAITNFVCVLSLENEGVQKPHIEAAMLVVRYSRQLFNTFVMF